MHIFMPDLIFCEGPFSSECGIVNNVSLFNGSKKWLAVELWPQRALSYHDKNPKKFQIQAERGTEV